MTPPRTPNRRRPERANAYLADGLRGIAIVAATAAAFLVVASLLAVVIAWIA